MVTGGESLNVKGFEGRVLGSPTFQLSRFTLLERARRYTTSIRLRMLLLLTLGAIAVSLPPAEAGTPTTPTGATLERESTSVFNRA